MKQTTGKQLIALLIAFLMIFNGFAVTAGSIAFAAPADYENVDVLAFTSDVHNDQKNYTGQTRLGTWIDNIVNQYGKIDAMAFGGDMAQYNSADAKFWSETQGVMDVVEGKGIAAYYTTGNHEYDHDSSITNDFYPDKNEVTRKYIQNDWAVSDNNHNYRIYCLGVGEASSSYTYADNTYTANQVSTLESKLAAVDNSKPIFIITHFPLHYNGSRTITRASNIIDVLNNAATGGTANDPSDDKKIVFIWGHNHSMSNPYDSHYDTIYQKGSSLQYDSSHSKETQFYYAAAGSMSDTEKDAGSGRVEGKGLVATVNSNDQISLTYYKADGTTVTKNGGPFEEKDPVVVENLTIDETANAGQSGLSVEAGKKLQLHATIEPDDATSTTVTWSSSDTTVATVSSTGQVAGVAEGQVTITATLTDSVSGEEFTADIVINVTPRTTSGTPYVLTNTLTPGKNYLIVSANSGDAYALMNDNGTISKEAVTVDGDTIYADNENIVFEAQGSGTTINDLHNGSRYLKASSSGLQLLTTAGTSRPWEYDGSTHKLTNYKSSSGTATHYYVYYENNAFASSTSTSSSHVVYLFEETEIPEDVTYNVTFKVQNGKWDDNTTADKTVQLTGQAGSVTLNSEQIPAVGTKPNSGYKAGSWNVTPDTTTPLTGNVTYTYTYEEQGSQSSEKAYVLTNTLTPGKNYIIASASSGTAHVLTSSSTTAAEVTIDGDTIYTDDASIVFTMGEAGGSANYIGNEAGYVNHTSDNYLEFVSTPPSGITWTYDGSYLTYKSGSTTYYLYYKSGTNYNRFRIKNQSTASDEQLIYLFEEVQTDVSHDVTFKVEHGKWNDDTTEEKTVTLTGSAGSELKLSADQIPAVGSKSDTHYKEGAWDVTPNTSTAITEDTTYTYTYEFVDHNWDDGVVTLDPTCTEEGVKTYTCSVGGETRTEAIPAAGHIWEDEFTEDTAPTCTEAGSKSKHCSVCGAIDESTATEIPATGHSFGDWTEVTPSGCENEGLEQRVCETCGFTESRNLDPSGHDWEDDFTVDLEPTCTLEGSKSIHCKNCDAVKDSETIDALGHDYQDVDGTAVAATCTENGKAANQECSRCHDVIEGAITDILGHDYQPVEGTAIEATCTEEGKEADQECSRCHDVINGDPIEAAGHSWDEGEVTTQPTCMEKGVKTFSCENCDATRTEEVAALGHNITTHPAVAATCTAAGNSLYYSCDRCEKFFSDPAAVNEIEEDSWIINATGHDYQTVEGTAVAATCTTAGKEADKKCSHCNDVIEGATIEALGHNPVHHDIKAPTCTEAGNVEYWSCDRCNKFFSDEVCETEVENNSWVIPAEHDWSKPTYEWARDNSSVTAEYHCTTEGCNEKVTETAEVTSEVIKQPTCTEPGETKYTATFEDPAFEDQEETDTSEPAALGHTWGDITYTWSEDNRTVTAKRVCGRDDSHVEEETVNTSSSVTQAATCTLPEKTTWTAEFTNDAFETQTKTEQTAEASGHDWSRPRYDWADDYSSVTGHYNCTTPNCDVEVTETVSTTSEVTKQATCTEAGETTYTATFEDSRLEDQEAVDSTKPAATGHTWGVVTYTWSEDNSKVTAERVCTKDESHKQTETVDATSEVIQNATCTDPEKTTWTSEVFENEAFQKQTKTEQTADAIGHAWGDVTYTWADDNSTVTAKRVCGNDDSHVEEETVSATAAVTHQASCTLPEKTTWTSENFENEAFDQQTKTEQTANALGHNMTPHAAVAATCTAAGNSAYWSCDRCHKYFSDEEGNTEVQENSWVIEAKGHKYGEWTKFDDEQHKRVCDHDASHVEKANHTWDDGEVTTAATCTTKGEKTYTCTVCGATKTEEVNALGHNMDEHPAVEATCTTAGNSKYYSCDRCHKFFSDEAGENEIEENSWVINATGHDWSKPTYEWARDNSSVTAEYNCTAEGCNEEVTETVNTTSEVIKQATCTEPGETKYTANFENPVFEDQEETDTSEPAALGHTWGEVTYTWAEDNRTVTAKRVCGRDDSHVEEETVNTSSSVTQAATCTLPEKTTWTAEFTNDAFETQTKTEQTARANGHDWSKPRYDWADDYSSVTGHYNCTTPNCDVEVTETVNSTSEVTKQATCTEAGETTYTATFEDPRLEDQEEVDATKPAAKGHAWDNGTVTTQPTCTAKGVKTFHCENCDATRTEDVDALGHNPKEHAAVEATCTSAGNSAYWSCDKCNKFFSDATCEHEIEENSWIVNATGHDYQTVEGSAVAATCTKDGKEVDKKCSHCNDVIEGAKINATEHSWDNGIVTTQPTCTTKGVKTFHCANCEETKTEDVAALGHDYQAVEGSAVAATCTKDGKQADKKCSHCKDVIKGAAIKATGHAWGNAVIKKATDSAAGSKTYTCKKCKETKVEKIAKLSKLGKTKVTAAGNVSKRRYTVKMNKVSGATGYKISYRKANAAKWSTKNAGSTSYNLTGLTFKGLYQIKAQATKNATATTEAVTGSNANVEYCYLNSARNLKYVPGSKRITMSWAKDTHTTGYEIQYSTRKDMKNAKIIKHIGNSNTRRIITELVKGKTYYVRIRPYKKYGSKTYQGVWSGVKAVKSK